MSSLTGALVAAAITAVTPLHPHAARLDTREVECLANTIYHEARGEPLIGQMLVAEVVVQRFHRGWAPTICAVIRQPGQFAPSARSARPNTRVAEPEAYRLAAEIAVLAKIGHTAVSGQPVVHFYNPREARPTWARRPTEITLTVGQHVFRSVPLSVTHGEQTQKSASLR
jgi:N-acetylmuramoyl-L-alanine amidase